MDALERLLTAYRPDIERELQNAELELKALREREKALQSVIGRARAALGEVAAPSERESTLVDQRAPVMRMSLHEALVAILRAADNKPLTARELAESVNREGLYGKRDGSPVDPAQVHARVHVYGRLFERVNGRIRLKDTELRSFDTQVLQRFDRAMLEVYDAVLREAGYAARRFLIMTKRRGGHEAARHLLARPGVSEGFNRLAEARKLSLSVEFQVLQPGFEALFTQEERAVARQRLLEGGLRADELP